MTADHRHSWELRGGRFRCVCGAHRDVFLAVKAGDHFHRQMNGAAQKALEARRSLDKGKDTRRPR